MSGHAPPPAIPAVDLEQRAEQLKERIYVTFGALAVTLALLRDASHASAGSTAATLVVAVLGTLLAVFLADVIAHITVHAALPDGTEFRHMLRVSLGSLGVLVVPLVLVALSAIGVVPIEGALRAISFVLVGTLVLVGYLAVRRLKLPPLQRLLILVAEFALGVLVLLLESVAH